MQDFPKTQRVVCPVLGKKLNKSTIFLVRSQRATDKFCLFDLKLSTSSAIFMSLLKAQLKQIE